MPRRAKRRFIYRRKRMPQLGHLSLGTIIFLIGAVIYVVNLVLSLARRGRQLPFDGIGLMVLGLGLALLLKL
jgi:hypothetical protein